MNEPHYTDPLVALYMREKFEMEFDFGDIKNIELLLRSRIYRMEPIVIPLHKNSIPILRVRVGDVIIGWAERPTLINRVDDEETCNKFFNGRQSVWSGNDRITVTNNSIIMRASKHFFMREGL